MLYTQEETTMTVQDVFNNAWNQAIVKAMPKCANADDNRCFYRNRDNACLVGVSVPDDKYFLEMEDNCIIKLFRLYPDKMKDIFGDIKSDVLNELQLCHDRFNIESYQLNIREELIDFATNYGLNIPE